MIEKRYFKREWEEGYYIFDSQVISEKEFDEKVEYEDYQAFADSMTGDDVVNRLNELNNENDILIKQRLGEERLKQEIADYHTSNSKLHQLNKCLIRLLDEFHIDYSDILREFK